VNEYELMTVFHPRLSADETAAAIASLEEQIAANGGELLSTDDWGRRRLAYPIDGVIDGNYVLTTFKMPGTGTATLERWMQLSETTLRHLLIRGIIPFEGDRYSRDERRDDDRGGDEDWDSSSGEDGNSDDDRREAPVATEAPAAEAEAEAPAADADTEADAADASED